MTVNLQEFLEIVGKVLTILLGFCSIAKWIVYRIEKGQEQVIAEHRRDFKRMKKELKKRVSRDECERIRAQCLCEEERKKMKIKTMLFFLLPVLMLTGCSTITHFDENGKITRIEKVTNFSRAMDGTNSKSQIMLVSGIYASFEASASAGENCTPGISLRYADGKVAIANVKEGADFTGSADVVEKFFADKTTIGKDGIKKE